MGAIRPLRVGVVLILISFILQSQQCNNNCKATLDVQPKRTSTNTQFTLKGSGYPIRTVIHLFVVNQPVPKVDTPVSAGTVTTDNIGNFTAYWDATYMPAGMDDQTRTPYFEATDQKGCNGIKETSSAYWFP
ncbi:hypothetical protein OIU83_01245 [Flavobacterium sp. LS1R49]|uniref:Uncharacterized protein n=1 Tax=Flavobacterium shii TaxID=2987687 RepID=A0A9X3BXC5_9FLAO|nr:hypothetical protein [Flavobacterium shii]MCV9926261.1 hypothetical protein [Flavobacterium shii]